MAEPNVKQTPEQPPRETVLDREVHLERGVVLEIPKIPPLCGQVASDKRRVDVGGCELCCEVQGEGTAVVLLHGGPGATHHGFHPHFSRAKDFAKIVYYDQRGCGSSDYKKGDGYSIEQAVNDLEELRKALEIEKWVVLGHSYGGLLAQCYAVTHPESFAGLLLVGSALAMPAILKPSRQQQFLSVAEMKKIRSIRLNRKLTTAQNVYNAFLNGDWKRQSYFRPSRERIAQTALYEWKHDPLFRNRVGAQTRNIDLEGAFEGCPIPTMVLEGKWDLTWNTDKPEILRKNHPRSELVTFERSSHSPFEDEPESFFEVLKGFLNELPPVSQEELAKWKEYLVSWQKRKKQSPGYVLRNSGFGRKSNEKIAENYSEEWLDKLSDPWLLLKTGFALYDLKKYEEATAAFKRMSAVTQNNTSWLAASMVWQAQMLDLSGKREEAVALYQKVVDLKVSGQFNHSQFGMKYSPSKYAAERLQKPFERIENRQRN